VETARARAAQKVVQYWTQKEEMLASKIYIQSKGKLVPEIEMLADRGFKEGRIVIDIYGSVYVENKLITDTGLGSNVIPIGCMHGIADNIISFLLLPENDFVVSKEVSEDQVQISVKWL
jgi:hypothetical protein